MANTLKDAQRPRRKSPKQKTVPPAKVKAKAKTKAKKTPAKKAAKANGAAGAGAGHNFVVNRKLLRKYNDQLDKAFDAKAKENARHASIIGHIKESACNELGVSRGVYNEFYAEHRFFTKRARRDKERDEVSQIQIDKMRLAEQSYKTTPLGQFAAEQEEHQAAAQEVDDGPPAY